MKTVYASLLAMWLLPTWANAATSDADHTNCRADYHAATAIMSARQQGASLPSVLDEMAGRSGAQVEAMAMRAYKLPLQELVYARETAVKEFGNAEFMRCLELEQVKSKKRWF
ncbi:hypothetical protein LVJ82_08615 [Vitreoscilla massiliensis]|uniref:Uncharacterized protein n=1 Tax=Vitreoscilla massiliensis TaxID=1689272 RepID=A0ABY4E6K2_9NEIS|nr:hypothetical protein [Vitreoscilla massiliensis]UOO91010.1 hypothetical protein LVJ82_08615 [Vitreoscilla massiliensis]